MQFAVSSCGPRLRRTFLLVACILTAALLTGAAVVLANGHNSHANSKSHRIQKRKKSNSARKRVVGHPNRTLLYENDAGEDVEGRQNWFMFQRTYPFESVPVGARRLAFQSRPERGKGMFETETQIWTPIGPQPTRSYAPLFSNFGFNSGRINAIAVSPADPQIILVGASTGGIWRSSDGGSTFTPVSDSQVDLAVGAIAFSRSSPNIVYAGMGDMQACCDYLGSGILKSTDAGLTWTHINNNTLPQPGSVGKIEVDPVFPDRLYVGLYRFLNPSAADSFPYGGIYLSTDGGINWTKTLAGLPRDLAISPANPQIVFAAMRGIGVSGNGGLGGLYKSVDGGQTWISSPVYASAYPPAFNANGLRDIRVAISPANPQKIYVYSGNGSSGSATIRLAVSTDGGNTFPIDGVLTTVDKGQFGYNTYLYADPFNAETVYIGARDVFRSTNGGTTWTNLTRSYDSSFNYSPGFSNAHPDQHSFAFGLNSNQFFIGNDGGIYKTADGGVTFQSLNTTLSLTQFVSIARHPSDASITYGGTQDNGTQKRQPASSQWNDFASGDGGQVVINPLDPSTLFTTYIYGSIRRWRSNGTSNDLDTSNSTFGEPSTGARIAFYPPFVGNGVDSKLYFGTWKLFVSNDLGASWSAPSNTDLTIGLPTGCTVQSCGDVLSAIGVARSNTNVIYTGSAMGRVMASTDGGQTWSNANTGLPVRFIASINVDYSNPLVAYLTVSGFGSGHVFKTTNGGASWSDISGIVGQGGLPNIPTSALLIDPANPNTLYAGTDVGVFRSTTGGNTWTTFSDGMPPVVVTAFSMNAAGQIQAATYGRGAFEASMAAPGFSVSGRVVDGFGNGIGGATVTVSGGASGVTTTDSGGNYTLTQLPQNGSFILTPTKAGQYVTFARTISNLNANTTGFDLRLDPFVTANVHVTDSNNNNLSGVAIAINNQSSGTTNAGGNINLNITVPAIGSVQIVLTPIKLGYGFNPSSFTFASQSGNQVVGFAAVPPNPLDDARTFVAQTYRDFLGREPDQGGLDYWSSQILGCGSDAVCVHNRRIDVSAAFFVEAEFQRTGSFAYRLYKGGLGRQPNFIEFSNDRAQVIDGPGLEASKQALALSFVQRVEFTQKYAAATTAPQFVDALIANIQQNSGVDLSSQRMALIDKYNTGTGMAQGRAFALRDAIDNTVFTNAEYNPSFVLMQYYGYLRRDPDLNGYLFWLDVLNNHVPGNFRSMVCGFITSAEYQLRFSSSVTRTNRDCAQ